jgi:hypothetical protein
MDSTLTNFDALKRSVDVHIHQFTNYGKAYMKKCDASPDAYAHRCHICTGAGLAAAASAPGLGEAAAEGTLLRPRDSCSLRWDRTCSAAPTAQRLALRYVQMAIVLAYYKLFGASCLHHETVPSLGHARRRTHSLRSRSGA